MGNPVGNGRSAGGHTLEYMTRAAEMVRLRSSGMTPTEIAAHYSVTYETVRQSLRAAINATPYEAVTEMRSIQLDSLNMQKRRLLRVFLADHPKVDHGHVVMRRNDEGQSVPVLDYDVTIRASAELRRIEDSISRLTGTRAPVVHEVHEITEDALDAEIAQLSRSIRLRAAEIDFPLPIDADSWPIVAELPPGKDAGAATAESAGSSPTQG